MEHIKPTVFFSHSSRDKVALATLRDVFKRKTGNTIDVFLSSDGQSIAFGSNWVHRVEEALAKAKLMFVFLTPDAARARSQWVPFEAGHAYGRGLHVVPVGIWGVDVGAIGPPLSLLQGFNATSRESLSNLIAITNREFGFTHEDFTADEYSQVISVGSAVSCLGEYGSLVDDVGTSLSERELRMDAASALLRLREIADRLGLEAVESEGSCRIAGLSVTLPSGATPPHLYVKADPGAFKSTLPLLNSWLGEVHDGGAADIRFTFTLAAAVDAVREDHKISGRLATAGVRSYEKHDHFIWQDIVFSVDRSFYHRQSGFEPGAIYVAVMPKVPELHGERVSALLNLLFEREILFLTA